MHATAEKASGSILRRCFAAWSRTALLGPVHALHVRMLRGHPDLILDSCSVRAKRGGDLTGPNPTDRAKKGSKYQVATTGDGLPVACAVTGANVPDTVLFERLFLAAFAVLARIRTVPADKGDNAEWHRELCRKSGVRQRTHKRGRRRSTRWFTSCYSSPRQLVPQATRRATNPLSSSSASVRRSARAYSARASMVSRASASRSAREPRSGRLPRSSTIRHSR